jgi:hypothetical protein
MMASLMAGHDMCSFHYLSLFTLTGGYEKIEFTLL